MILVRRQLLNLSHIKYQLITVAHILNQFNFKIFFGGIQVLKMNKTYLLFHIKLPSMKKSVLVFFQIYVPNS